MAVDDKPDHDPTDPPDPIEVDELFGMSMYELECFEAEMMARFFPPVGKKHITSRFGNTPPDIMLNHPFFFLLSNLLPVRLFILLIIIKKGLIISFL